MTDKQKNYIRAKAIEQKNKERILAVCPQANENSGIYTLHRRENGFHYVYVGQAKHLLSRLAQHFSGYQHIDLSLKKRGLYDVMDNQTGWDIVVTEYPESELDEQEQRFIRECANSGAQLYNHTTGGQGDGKRALGEAKSPKGYHDGLKQGYENARRESKHLFDLHLNAVTKANKPSKLQLKAMDKFNAFLQGESENAKKND